MRSLKQNISWTLAGNLVYLGSQWGILVVLAKLGSSEMVGQFSLGQAVAGPVLTFSMLQLRGYQSTDIIGEYRFGHYFALRLLTSGLGLLAVALISFALGYRAAAFGLIMVVGLFKAVESVSDVCYGAVQRRERMDRIALGQMIKGLLLLGGLSAGLYSTGSLILSLIGMTALLLAMLFVYDIQTVRTLLHLDNETVQPVWRWKKLATLANASLPLGATMLLTSLNSYMPRYFIEHSHGAVELGIFTALASSIQFGGMLMMATGQSTAPRYAQYYYNRDRRAFFLLVVKSAGIGFALGGVGLLVAVLWGKELITLLFGSDFVRYKVFIILSITGWLQYTFSMGSAITAARYIKIQVPMQIILFCTLLLTCWLLIPAYGIIGAAYSLLAWSCIRALFVLALLLHLAIQKLWLPTCQSVS